MENKLKTHNDYANKLIQTQTLHIQMVEDLVLSVRSLKTLHWIKFSRELDHIKDLYRNSIIDIVLNYKREFKTVKLENTLISDKMKDFSKIINERFDEVYHYFETINGLK